MPFSPHFASTHIGSVPHRDFASIYPHLIASQDIPGWPQFPRRTFKENMYVQFCENLPGIMVDEVNEKVLVNTRDDLTLDLEAFYERYLADDVDSFALSPDYAAGFYALLETLDPIPGEWLKGQVTGPVSIGLTITDQDLRASLYHDLLADAIVKNAAMSARWQIRQLQTVRPNVILFVDEPYMASFGSAYISLSQEQVIAMLDEVFAAIHAEGALAGVHCCGNTDWSVLMATTVDILNIDAYSYVENLALFPDALRAFLDRGGVVAWGIVPNNETIAFVTPEQLAEQLRAGIALICQKAQARGVLLTPPDFENRSLITPSCGLGTTTPDIAERVLHMLGQVREILR